MDELLAKAHAAYVQVPNEEHDERLRKVITVVVNEVAPGGSFVPAVVAMLEEARMLSTDRHVQDLLDQCLYRLNIITAVKQPPREEPPRWTQSIRG